jgi:hypothetical protein
VLLLLSRRYFSAAHPHRRLAGQSAITPTIPSQHAAFLEPIVAKGGGQRPELLVVIVRQRT